MPNSLHSAHSDVALTFDCLRAVPVFAKLPELRLQWVLDQSQEVWLQAGGILRSEGDLANCLFVLLSGQLHMTQRVGTQDLILARHARPALIGEVPLLMGVPYFWASGRAITNCHLLELSADTFWQFMGLCPAVSTSVLRTMVERMQEVQILAQHRERLISLGTLAAGLAHELNNPASAARRAARQLREVFPILQTQTLKLTHQSLARGQRDRLIQLQQEAINRAQTAAPLDPMTQSDREDEITQWLEAHQVETGWRFASTFVNAGLDRDWLTQLSTQLSGQCLNEIMVWLDATLTVVGLLNTLGHSTGRIQQLVEAVQDYSSLDGVERQPIPIQDGIESTLTILEHKLKRGITVIRDYADDLPMVMAHAHELEQVWMNLLDNAIDAVNDRFSQTASTTSPEVTLHTNPVNIPTGWETTIQHSFTTEQQHPCIWIHTRCENDYILVEIVDNGVGIPSDVQPYIFEPFFTTKAVGQGTGLGLNTSYKIVQRYGGDIRVTSRPGDTCFQVRFPSQC